MLLVIPSSRTMFLGLLAVALGAAACSGGEPAVFRAGAATADLTPNDGVSLDGPISKNGPVRGVHDPLQARAIVLSQGETTLALVINDMCMIDREVYDEAKRLASEETGIPAAHMLMAATHSHATPRVMRISTRPADEAYRQLVARRIADAVRIAHGRLAPAEVAIGSFDRPDLIACRRFHADPDTLAPNPFGQTGEQIKSVSGTASRVIGPAGPIDPQVTVLAVRHTDGSPLAVLANYSAHYCGGYERGMVSADYFGAFARHVQADLAASSDHPRPVAILSNGTSGNTGAIRPQAGRQPAWENIDKAGQILAADALRLLEGMPYSQPAEIAVATSEREFAVRKPTPERIAWARDVLAHPAAKHPHRWTPIYAAEALHLAEFPERVAVPLQAIRIGEIGIAAAPCEVFAETGLAIKRDSPLKHTFTIELAGGYHGYLPPPEQHQLGGYETWPARSSHLEVDAEPQIRAELLRLLGATQ